MSLPSLKTESTNSACDNGVAVVKFLPGTIVHYPVDDALHSHIFLSADLETVVNPSG